MMPITYSARLDTTDQRVQIYTNLLSLPYSFVHSIPKPGTISRNRIKEQNSNQPRPRRNPAMRQVASGRGLAAATAKSSQEPSDCLLVLAENKRLEANLYTRYPSDARPTLDQQNSSHMIGLSSSPSSVASWYINKQTKADIENQA